MKLLKSRTVWTLAFAFVTNGFMAIQGNFDPTLVLVINGLFSVAAAFFKINPSQKY